MTAQPTILVVEDEDSFVDALTVGLAREGFRVQVARDGAQALDLFDVVRPDLVLLDVMLPKVSGIDGKTFQKKAVKGWKQMRVVITDPVPVNATFQLRLVARVN